MFDTAGVHLRSEAAPGGFIISRWPGRFDGDGYYYSPVPYPLRGDAFHIGMVRYDSAFTPLDTLQTPRDPETRELFRNDDGRIMASVPFQGGLGWELSSTGTIWAMITDQYRLFELSPAGDTLRTITRAFDPLPVTDADREQAREDLIWFTDQGGRVDWSKVPSSKPPVTSEFFLDDEHNIWVERVSTPEDRGRNFDVFDPDGRYLGIVRLPFPLERIPRPVIRAGLLYGVTRDDLEVPHVVRARITKPE